MASQRRFEIHTQRYGDKGFRPFATVHCRDCSAIANINVAADQNKRLPDDLIQRKLERLGWSIGSNNTNLCPRCGNAASPLQHKGDTMTSPDIGSKKVVALSPAQAPAPNRKKHALSFPQRLKLFEFLKAVCKTTPEGFARYDEGWNDARVAKDIGDPYVESQVAGVRRQMIGLERRATPSTESAALEARVKDLEARLLLIEQHLTNSD